jgi:hypothetical protein
MAPQVCFRHERAGVCVCPVSRVARKLRHSKSRTRRRATHDVCVPRLLGSVAVCWCGFPGGARRDRKGFILLKEVLPGSVHPVDETMFNGKMNVFQIETKERTFYLQGDTVDAMDDWLDSILRSIQTRGRMQSVSAALEAGEMDSLDGGEVSRDSTMLGPDQASQAALGVHPALSPPRCDCLRCI